MDLINQSAQYIAEEIRGRKKTRSGRYLYKIKWKFWPENQCTWEPKQNLASFLDVVEAYDKLYVENKVFKGMESTSKASLEVKQNMMKRNIESEQILPIFQILKQTEKIEDKKQDDENVQQNLLNSVMQEQPNSDSKSIEECQIEPKVKDSYLSQQMNKQQETNRFGQHKSSDLLCRLKKNIRKFGGIADYNKKCRQQKQMRQKVRKINNDPDDKQKQTPIINYFTVFEVDRSQKRQEVKIVEIDKEVNDERYDGKGKLTMYREKDFPKYEKILKGLLQQYRADQLTNFSNNIRKLNTKSPCFRQTVECNQTTMQLNQNNDSKMENDESDSILEIAQSDFYSSLKRKKDEQQQDQLKISDFLKFGFKRSLIFDGNNGQLRSDSVGEELNQSKQFFQPKIVMKQLNSVNPVRNLLNKSHQEEITNFQKYYKMEQSGTVSMHGGFRKYQDEQQKEIAMKDMEQETPLSQNQTDFKQPVIKIKQMVKEDGGPSKTRRHLGHKQNKPFRKISSFARIRRLYHQRHQSLDLQAIDQPQLLSPDQNVLSSEKLNQLGPISLIEQFDKFCDLRQYKVQIGNDKKVQICMRNQENELCEVLAEDIEKHYASWVKMFYQSFI